MPATSIAPRLLAAAGAACLTLAGLATGLGTAAAAPAASSATHWTTGKPLPAAKGTGLRRNEDGEPGMGVTPSGQFWIASDIAPYAADDPRVAGGLLSGADVWTSTDGGRSYRWVSDPFGTGSSAGLAGEDTDLAVAPQKNSKGFYNVYAASLWVGSTSLATSPDGGKTWNVNPLGGVPAQDRPWLAADGPCTVYVAYHQLPAFSPFVNAYDTCTVGNGVPVSNGVALDPTHSTQLSLSSFPGLSGSFNKLTVDTSPKSKHRHAIYIPMSLCQVASAPDLVINANSSGCPKGTQYIVAVSTDRGQTFTYHPVALDKSGATLVWAATVATDAAGRVYYTWSDSHNVYLDVSTDGGVHWTKPRQLNGAKTAAVYPTVAGGSAGRVDVAWYGADRKGDSNSSKIMGQPSVKGSVPWKVMLARSTDGGKHFATRAVTGPIHLGELCTHGSGCADTNSRNLLDDFGLVISPTTGHDSITYTADRPDGTAGHAFTGFVSEVGPAKRSSGHGSTGGTHGRHHSSGGRSGASGGSSSGRGLAATGLSPAIALVGLGLLTTGLLLRRRTVR